MSFTSVTFLVFLALVCVVSYAITPRARYVFLLVASYGFYLYSPRGFTQNLPAFLLLLAATLVSFLCALGLQTAQRKPVRIGLLCVSLAACLGMLLVCKYANFFLETVQTIAGGSAVRLNLILPLGISYYTLQTVSYTMDVYRRKYTAERNPLRYALYVSFFPGIVTGPINRANSMLPQYASPARFNYEQVSGGLFRVLWGLFKKMVLADNIGAFTRAVFSAPETHTGPVVALAGLLFAYQLYLDFAGSCDVAIGAARMMGFTFMENFKRPFAAKTFAQLWKRWHISLTSFLREYLYFPLGGNRVGQLRWLLNTLVVFLVSGLWHGASVGYVVWGLANGVIMIVAKALHPYKEKAVGRLPVYRNRYVRGVFSRVGVYLLFAGCLVFFAASMFGTTVPTWFGGLFSGWGTAFGGEGLLPLLAKAGLPLKTMLVLAGGTLLVEGIEAFGVRENSTMADWVRRRYFFVRWPLYYLLVAAILVFGVFGKSAFIYQQF